MSQRETKDEYIARLELMAGIRQPAPPDGEKCPNCGYVTADPFNCPTCEARAEGRVDPVFSDRPAPPTEREGEDPVVAAARAWLKARQDNPQTVGVAINESGAAVIHAILARLRTHSPSEPWPCGCKPWSSDSGDYCPEHRLRLGSIEQRIAATERYLADLRGDSPEEPVGEVDWNRCVLVTQGLDAGRPDAIAIEVADLGEWEGASGHHHLGGRELIDAWVLAQDLGWPLVAVPRGAYRCTPDNPPSPIGQPLDSLEAS